MKQKAIFVVLSILFLVITVSAAPSADIILDNGGNAELNLITESSSDIDSADIQITLDSDGSVTEKVLYSDYSFTSIPDYNLEIESSKTGIVLTAVIDPTQISSENAWNGLLADCQIMTLAGNMEISCDLTITEELFGNLTPFSLEAIANNSSGFIAFSDELVGVLFDSSTSLIKPYVDISSLTITGNNPYDVSIDLSITGLGEVLIDSLASQNLGVESCSASNINSLISQILFSESQINLLAEETPAGVSITINAQSSLDSDIGKTSITKSADSYSAQTALTTSNPFKILSCLSDSELLTEGDLNSFSYSLKKTAGRSQVIEKLKVKLDNYAQKTGDKWVVDTPADSNSFFNVQLTTPQGYSITSVTGGEKLSSTEAVATPDENFTVTYKEGTSESELDWTMIIVAAVVLILIIAIIAKKH